MLNLSEYPVNISVKFYFKVFNSDLFGGKDSIGYTCMTLENCQNPEKITDESCEGARILTAEHLHVNPEDVKFVSRAEYENYISKNGMETTSFDINKPAEFIEDVISKITKKASSK